MKYIVYLTINTKSQINGLNRIFIGTHATNNPNIFDGYLGDGVYINQASTFKYPKTPLQCAVKKYGADSFRRETLFTCDSLEEALKYESGIVTEDFINQDHVYNAYTGGSFGKEVYQFDTDGKLIKKWKYSIEISEFYGFSREKVSFAISNKHILVGSFWSYKPTINIKEYSTKSPQVVHLFSKNGKWLKEFLTREDCGKYIGVSEQEVYNAVQEQRMVLNKYYISNKISDQFNPRIRRQYRSTIFYVFKNGEYKGSYKGKEVMNVIDVHSWQKIGNIMTIQKGWYKEYYLSETKITELPERDSNVVSIDVYNKYGTFIETLKSILEVREKYNIPASKMKNIQLGEKYFGDHIFRYNSKK